MGHLSTKRCGHGHTVRSATHQSHLTNSPLPPAPCPALDPAGVLQFVVNAKSGHNDQDASRLAIDAALQASGRRAVFHAARPGALARVAQQAAQAALAQRSAVVAVGGDGTINTVAQTAHALGCPMGVVPQGTFNYFGRTHGIPTDAGLATQALLAAQPAAVQLGLINDQVFLVNASLGLYPDLLQDREAFKARFGRNRLVALAAAVSTVLGRHRTLRLRIETRDGAQDVRTLTLFVGNNQLQLAQVGLPEASAIAQGQIAAVVLRPIGTLALLGLMLRGALGTLGDAPTVDSFQCQRLRVSHQHGWAGRRIKVAYDGEVGRMATPLLFQVSPRPLYLLKPAPEAAGGAPLDAP